MAGEVTLTSSMRANLYSLQQTAQLMGTVQNRLSTGKKVNSALDNPNNYFTAQTLSNRASDIGALLDGMGQAIQTIKAATQGIQSAQSLIDQMKAVANSALSTAASSADGARSPVDFGGELDTAGALVAADEDDNTLLLTNLRDEDTGASAGVTVGMTLTLQENTTDVTKTFTVAETTTMKDLTDWLDTYTTASITSAGLLSINSDTANTVVDGTLAVLLGVNNADLDSGTVETSSITLGRGPMKFADAAGLSDDVFLTGLTDADGVSLGIAYGDTLTIKAGDSGETLTFTVGGSNDNNSTADANGGGSTLDDLETWLEAQTDISAAAIAGSKLTIQTTNTLDVAVGGKLAEILGVDGDIAKNTTATGTETIYYANQHNLAEAEETTLLRDLSTANGTQISGGNLQAGDDITVTITGMGVTTIDITEGMTVKDLMNKINAIDSDLQVSLDSQGRLVVDNQTSVTVTFGGTAGAGIFKDPNDADATFAANTAGNATTSSVTLWAGFTPDAGSVSGSSVIDATKKAQFDTLRTQLDELVKDASYQGVNLISSSSNTPLTVTFNEAATNASKLVISAVDLTTSGLAIKGADGDAAGAWMSTDAVRDTLSTLTSAATTLRNQAATLGYNLSTVQNRQDFAQNMIATLKEGADKLTLADMNEEGANMLALQTRSQLGTQSLSLASQANQSVMRLFG